MQVFGTLSADVRADLQGLVSATAGLTVVRSGVARSSKPLPKSLDLEASLVGPLGQLGFGHQLSFSHPRIGVGFAFDFWRARDGVALEVMGYRADDEV